MIRMLGVGVALVGLLALGAPVRADEPAGREQMKIEKQIQANLESDRDLGNNKIDVRVSEGVATLKGTVDSEAERGHAVTLASVPGVRVIDDQLKVGAAAARAAVTDSSVTTRVKSQLLASNDLRNAEVAVTTSDGVVTLAGAVASEELRRLAIELARHTPGVLRVDDQIKVAVPPPFDPRLPTR